MSCGAEQHEIYGMEQHVEATAIAGEVAASVAASVTARAVVVVVGLVN